MGRSEKQITEQITVLTAVFRFLDPNGDGEVSAKEFTALEGVWRELRQTTWEFVCHLRWSFGTLRDAWGAADEDGSGMLSNAEFIMFARNCKFHGPIQQIYMLLDPD